jgi:hypothetical protein
MQLRCAKWVEIRFCSPENSKPINKGICGALTAYIHPRILIKHLVLERCPLKPRLSGVFHFARREFQRSPITLTPPHRRGDVGPLRPLHAGVFYSAVGDAKHAAAKKAF